MCDDLADQRGPRHPPARRGEVSRQNLTDRLYYSSKGDGIYNGGGYAFGTPGLPRTVMFNVKRTF